MPCIRGCKNINCNYNSEGCYCEALEIELDERGECVTFWPDNSNKQEEE